MMRIYENIGKTSENRLAPRSYYIPEGSSEYLLLNGEWRFRYFSRDIEAVDPVSEWDIVSVPFCWQNRGYENPNYSNINYPFPCDPPYVPDDNPCGIYEREFEIEKVWGKLYFVFEGVSSCAFLYINGDYVGFTEGSHLQAEFDITDFVKSGINTVRVKVLKWCCGSYLEDQDAFRCSGIFRDCYILQRPEDHVTDVTVTAENNKITVNAGKEAVISLFDMEGRKLGEKLAFSAVFFVDAPVLWNAEKPYLYNIKIVRDGEEVRLRTGFRTIAISDNYALMINGTAVKLHGVNHHDTHPLNGWCQTREELRRDLELMKELNINCIRTSHYPPAPYFMDMCDELGFYVILETDIEAHGFIRRHANVPYKFDAESPDWPCSNPDWKNEFLERMQRAALMHRNHASIIMWSTGNESGFGPNQGAMIEWLRTLKDSRLIHCEDASRAGETDCTDVYSRMYLSVPEVEALVKSKDIKQPIFLCEYAHAMGNGPGGVYDYNLLFDSNPQLIGGCIWEWSDHVAIVGGIQKYGGDFAGELTHDGNFCCDGMVFADRTFKAGTMEIKKAYQPIRTEFRDGKLYITNRMDFTGLEEYEFEYSIECDGKEISCNRIFLSTLPHETEIVEIKTQKRSCLFGMFLNCRLSKNGKTAAETQHRLDCEKIIERTCEIPANVSEDEQNIYFCGNSFSYVFDKHYAAFTSLKVEGREQLAGRPMLSVWRAPTDNDRHVKMLWGKYNEWQGENFDVCFTKVYSCIRRGNTVVADCSLSGISRKPFFRYRMKISVFADGTISWKTEGKIRENTHWLPRLGYEFRLPGDNSSFKYFGRGPLENYSDMCAASRMGMFESNTEQEYVGYVRPQEHGNHTGVRFLKIGELVFTAAEPFEINVSKFSTNALTCAEHTDELKPDGETHLRIDYKVSGLGSNSCGPLPQDKYLLNEKQLRFAFSVKPEKAYNSET